MINTFCLHSFHRCLLRETSVGKLFKISIHHLEKTGINVKNCATFEAKFSTSRMASNCSKTAAQAGKRKALVGICQMTSTASKADNMSKIAELVKSCKSRGAKMVFLPEASDYIGESKQQTLEYAEPMDGPFMSFCKNLAAKQNLWLSVGFHEKSTRQETGNILNTQVVIDDKGTVKATYSKTHLFDLDIPGKVKLMESEYVTPGARITPPVESPVGQVGLAICYDMRFPELSLALAQQGAHILTYPSAFTVATGMAHWESLLRCRAIETQCYVVAAAQTGKHNDKRASYGHSMVIDPWGVVVAQCSDGTGICTAEIDLDYVTKLRRDMPVWLHRRTDLYGRMEALDSQGAVSPDVWPEYQFGHVRVPSEQVFLRSTLSYAFVNIKPVLPGHMLIAPLRPAAHLSDLRPAEVTDLFLMVQRVADAVNRQFQAISTTVAVQDGPDAGQTVKHFHVHVIPRKPGDFQNNDDIYDHLQHHDVGWTENTKFRTPTEMTAESTVMRGYFYPTSS